MSICSGLVVMLDSLLAPSLALPPEFQVFARKRTFRLNLQLYVEHIQTSLGLTNEMLAAAYNLLLHFNECTHGTVLTTQTIQKVLLVSISVVYKYFSEQTVSQAKLAEIGAISVGELSAAEAKYLETLDWRISIGEPTKTVQELITQVPIDSSSEPDEDYSFEHLKVTENEELSELSAFFC